MIDSETLVEIGTFTKSHGTNGCLILKTNINNSESLKKNEPVFVFMDNLPVPFFIEELKKHSQNKFIIKFLYYDNISEIEELLNKNVFIKASDSNEDESNFEGFTLYNLKKEIGTITFIDNFKGNIVLTIKNKDNKEILIPLAQEFIKEIDFTSKKLFLELPDGLLNI